ncbi:MAG: DMT family transporter [Granulosicoccus sp.]
MILNIAALIFFGICWGSTIPLLKFATEANHHPLGMLIWQLGISALLLGAILRCRSLPLAITRQHIQYLLLIAMLGTLIPNTFSLMATAQLPGGIMAIVIATVPIVSLAIALLFKLEAFIWYRFIGVVLGVFSLMLIALPDATLPDPSKAPWVLIAIIAPVCYAVEGVFVAARAPQNLDPVSTLFGASVCGLIILVPIVYAGGWQVPVLVAWDTSRLAMMLAAIGHMIAYTGYLWLLRRAGAVFTSQVAYVVTLTGVTASVVFLDERYGWLLWLAVALMLAAVTLVRPGNTQAGPVLEDVER